MPRLARPIAIQARRVISDDGIALQCGLDRLLLHLYGIAELANFREGGG
jgi:hypothetical protein